MSFHKTHFVLMLLLILSAWKLIRAQNSEQYLKGIGALKNQDTLKAIDYFNSSIKRNKDKESYWELAKIYNNYNEISKLHKAEEMLDKAIKNDSKNIEYRLLLGEVLEKLFKISFFDKDARNRAIDVYEEILEINFATPKAHFRLGILYKEDFYEYVNSYRLNDREIDYKYNLRDRYFDRASTKLYNEFINSLVRDDQIAALNYNDLADSFFDTSVSHFLNAIKYDSLNITSYIDLAMLYDYKGEYKNGIEILLTCINYFPDKEKLYLEAGYVYNDKKEFEKSEAAFNKAFSLMSESELNIYQYETVLYLFDHQTMDKFNSFSEEQKRVYIKKYWEIKDPLSITKYNERELKHYSRVYYANYYYGQPGLNLKGYETDMGNIVIRYGLPPKYKRIRPELNKRVKTPKSEIWDYGDKVFSFVDITNRNNFRFASKVPLTNNYKLPYYSDSYELSNNLQITHPEDYNPEFEGPLFEIPYNAVQFMSLESQIGETDFYINYALDIKDGQQEKNDLLYKHKFGIFYKDDNFNEIFSVRDSIQSLSANDEIICGSQKYAVNSILILSEPEQVNLAFEIIREKDKGVSAYHGKMEVRDFTGDSLMLSDVVLASDINLGDEETGTIQRGVYRILPNPTRTFSRENKPFIFYEIYNLQKGENNLTNFEQEITIRKKEDESNLSSVINSFLDVIGFDSKGNEISLSSNYSTIETDPQIYLQLDLNDYEPGEYVISVSIKDKMSGRETNRIAKIVWL